MNFDNQSFNKFYSNEGIDEEIAKKIKKKEQDQEGQDQGEIDQKCNFDYKQKILENAINVANKINDNMLCAEENKENARKDILSFLKFILGISIVVGFLLVFFKGLGKLLISDNVILGVFIYIIANIIAVMGIMIKYITKNDLLETFEKVTTNLLEFLINENKETK